MFKLICGDCFEHITHVQDGSIDLVLCDLPYGKLADKTRAKWDNHFDYPLLFKEYQRIIKPKGAIVLFGNEPFSSYVRGLMFEYYKYDIKWIKSKTTGFANANYRPMNKYEDIMVFSKANASSGGRKNNMTYNPQGLKKLDKVKKNNPHRQGLIQDDTNNLGSKNSLLQESVYVQRYTNYPCNVVYFNNPHKYVHPTQKPVALCEYLIRTYSDDGDTVLDNCMGSGTVGVACKNTNRNFIGMELNQKYYNIAEQRIYQTRLEVQ